MIQTEHSSTHPAGVVVFILSDVRSGSTVLDQVLGANPQVFSLGEVHWLKAYALEDRELYDPIHPLLCTCGKPVSGCVFWGKVSNILGRPLGSLELIPDNFGWRGRGQQNILSRIAHLPRHLLEYFPTVFRSRTIHLMFGGSQVSADSIALYEAVFEASGARYLIDSSKSSFRFRLVNEIWPDRVRVIFLARDYRAVVHSKMKRGAEMSNAARGWRRTMTIIDALTSDLPPNRLYKLKYESLCSDPHTELTSLCRFLDLEFTPAMLERPVENIHHIGGSPSKFDSSRSQIKFDTTHDGAFDKNSLALLRCLVGSIADDWEY